MKIRAPGCEGHHACRLARRPDAAGAHRCALVGEEEAPLAQLSLLGAMLLLVLLFSRRRRKAEPTDAWDEVSET